MKVLAAILLLTGCATPGTFDGERPLKVGQESRWVTLERTYTATEDCGRKASAPPGWRIVACASYNDVHCTIRMQPDASDDTLGHETRRCFDGAWHS